MGTKTEQIKGTRGIANERAGHQFISNSLSKKILYEKALNKIREIAKSACDSRIYNSICKNNCELCSDGKILGICKEVLND